MSEEEKKAIEMLDKFITEHKLYNIKQSDYLEDNIKIVLYLIEKQQKEIEELKKWHDVFLEMYIHKDKVGANYISKDKIREKIKELEKFDDGYNEDGQPELNWVVIEKINLLQELLEEK